MATYFVTRHSGAKDWARRHGIEATFVEHLDPNTVRRGDIVIGTMPAQVIAEINRRGARYAHLSIDLREAERGRDLAADDMERMNARLEEISARSAGPYPTGLTILPRRATSLGQRWRRSRAWLRQWLSKGRERVSWTIALILLVLLGVPGALMTIATEAWQFGGWAALIVALALSGLVYTIAFLVLSVVARTVVWSRLRAVPEGESSCRVLIMGLSELPAREFDFLSDVKAAFPDRAARYALPTQKYLDLPDAGGPELLAALGIKWQQNVRACDQHGDALAMVLVLPSDESHLQWQEFLDFVRHFFPGVKVELVLGDDGKPFKRVRAAGTKVCDYEDYAYVWAGLSRAVDQAQERFAAAGSTLADDEICVDVTGGTKPFSMAAANVTLNRELRLSYVSPGGIVSIYNAEIDTVDALRRVLNAGGAGL